jgi:hypothetical protein
MNRNFAAVAIALLAGLLPIFAAHGAYLVNVCTGSAIGAEFVCMPYFEGCVSISRAARSGPGLLLFRALMLPNVFLLLLTWEYVRRWLLALNACSRKRAWTIAILGMVGALFLVFYVTSLGTEGEWYRWQRRYGVTVYFGGTALAQLLLVAVLWPQRRQLDEGRLLKPIASLMGLICVQWLLGVFSAFKRLIFDDPDFIDRLENVIEWWYALPMATGFIVIAWLFSRSDLWPASRAESS